MSREAQCHPLLPALGLLARRLTCLFYFTLRCLTETEDLGWLELPDSTDAYNGAPKIARAYRAALVAEGQDPTACAIEGSNQSHQVIQSVPL